MATVEDRVVAMSFENDHFNSNVNQTVGVLGRLKQALNFSGATKGLQDIEAASNKVDLSHIASAVDSIKSRFTGLGLVATATLASIVNRAVGAGISLVKSFTVDPIVAGFHNYETQINAVQTIMANTGLKGSQGLGQVTAVLKDLNRYANQTVYNFSDMTKNIGTFTAAGVDLKTSAASIKGIANLAALSGSTSDQASTAMYQLSQAIAANQVHLQDWNSVVNAGLGGKVFQEALFNTAEAMGRIKDAKVGETFAQWTNAGHSFRQSLQDGWINAKVLTTTLKGFTGDMSDAQLKAIGYSASQIAHIKEMGQTAKNAATNIKTMTQLTQALKEEVATAWAAVFGTIFGNINQATSIFSKLHTVLENALTGPIYALNNVLQDWAKAGGRTTLIDALKHAWADLSRILGEVKLAWRDVFPATTGNDLVSMTDKFDAFVKRLTPAPKTLSEIQHIFAGLFAVLDIGKTVIGDVFHVFGNLLGLAAGPAGGGFLHLAAHVGDLLVKVDHLVKSGDFLTAFFTTLGSIISDPVQGLEHLGRAISSLFSGVSSSGAWDKFVNSLHGASKVIQPLIQGLGDLFHSIVTFLTQTLQNLNFDQVLHGIDVGLLGGIYLLFKRFFGGAKITDLVGGGILGSVKETIEGLTGSLHALQTNLKANALLEIAIAVGVLAAGMVALSTVPAPKLNTALSGMTIAMGELVGSLALLSKIESGPLGSLKLAVLAGGLVLLAGAIDLLAVAVKTMSGLSWNQLEKGLAGIAGILIGIMGAVETLSANSAGMISAGLGIIGIATGIRIISGAIKELGGLSWEAIAKGVGAVAATLISLGLATKLFPSGMVGLGLGLLAISGGIKVLASAIADFGDLSYQEIFKGLVSIAGALGLISLGMHAMPEGMVVQAAGLVLISLSLKAIAGAIREMGGLDSNVIGKGLLTLGGALTILAVAMTAMQGGLGGAAAMVVMAGALAMLVPEIEALGHMSMGDIAKGLLTLALALGAIALTSQLIEPAAPAILALGLALLSIGGAIALTGAGIFLISTGLSALAVSGPLAIAVIVKTIENFAVAVPKFISTLVDTVLHIAQALADAAPQFVQSIGHILVALAQAVIVAAPNLEKAFTALVQAALKAVRDNFPQLVKTGLGMIVALLKGIRDHIGEVVTQAVGVITTFLNAIAKHLPKILQAGANLLYKFLEGIANNIGKIVSAGVDIVVHLINGIASNIKRIVKAGTNLLLQFVGAVLSVPQKLIDAGVNWVVQILNGIAKNSKKVIVAATNLIGSFITEVAHASVSLANKGADAVIYFLNGIAKAIRTHSNDLWNAGWNIASAIVDGLIQGIENLAHHVWDKIKGLVTGIPGIAKHILGISSPSSVFFEIGDNITQGLVNGIDNNSGKPVDAVASMAQGMVNTMATANDTINNLLDFHTPTITPVLDLSEVKKGAYLIPGYMPLVQAPVLISGAAPSGPDTAPADQNSPGLNGSPGGVTFVQNNYSPTALSEVDIYRATKNQISQLGGSTLASDAARFAGSN